MCLYLNPLYTISNSGANLSNSIECITSCYVGDIAHRKAFGSISKTTYSPICPTLIVNVQLEPSSMSRRRMTMDSPTSSIAQFYDTDDKLTIFFRPGPKDTPPLTAWAREIQNNLRTSQSRRSSAVTFGLPDRRHRDSFRAVPYDLKIAEDEWEEELANQQAVGQLTTRSSEESGSRSGGSGHSEHGVTSPMPTMHEFEHRGSVSAADSPIDPQELSPGMGHGEYMAYASVASSPGRRETILDRAFSMNYIPASPSNSTTTPSFYPHANPNITSVARFEALAADPGMPRNTNNNRYKGLDLDPSVMPASFFSSHQ